MNILVIKYVIINILLFSSWYLFLFSKRFSLSFIDRLIGTFILGLAQIIATELALGIIFNKLYADPLFAINISISMAVLSLSFFNNKSSYLKNAAGEFKDKTAGFFRTIKSDFILFILFALVIINVCWLIFIGYLFPSYTWDALWYHLPIVGHILQSGAIIENPANFMIDTFINIFPKNMELIFLWNVIFLKSDVITDLSQLPFTLIGVITTYSIATKLKINERYALYSSFLFFFTPIIIMQSTTNYIDIAVSVLLLVTINFLLYENHDFHIKLLNIERQPDRKIPILMAGISAGILLGSKGSGPLFAILFSLAIIVQEIIKHRRKVYATGSSLKNNILRHSLGPYILYFFIPLLLIGGYWFIKNWLLYGNPVYPMEIAVFGKTIFKGLYKGIIDPAPAVIQNASSLAGLIYVWMERVEYYLYDSRLSGFGPIWFILFLPSLALIFINSIIKKRYNWLFITILLIIIFLAHPRNWNTRYVIFILALGALSYGFVLDYFSKRERLLSIIALLLAVYTSLTANSPCVMPAKIKEFLNLPANERTIARLAPFNIDLNAKQEYGNWIWISNNISEGDVLAYTFEPLFLSPLWNSGFSSRTAYIKSENYNNWLRKLKDNNVTYVLLRRYSKEDEWIDDERKALSTIGGWFGRPKEKFNVVFSDDNYKIMQFLKTGK
ncbi:MAG: hypothetical protein Q7U10_07875 [Thermodesulfovibrionia bacterium]|nr:hypothetical protein [Thermodesulfovibrionia bacterium]